MKYFQSHLAIRLAGSILLGMLPVHGQSADDGGPPPRRSEAKGERPFVLVSPDELDELRARANRSPWREMKEQALADAEKLSIWNDDGEFELGNRFTGFRDVISANALAWILDPEHKAGHLEKLYKEMSAGLVELDKYTGDPYGDAGWLGNTAVANVLFNAIIALDIVRDELAPERVKALEEKIEPMQAGISNWPPSPGSVQRIWDIYRGKPVDQLTPPEISAYGTKDGVFTAGTGYGFARLSTSNREHKHLYMDVFARHGHKRGFYEDEQLSNIYEFLYGYVLDPMGHVVPFGDSTEERPKGANMSTAVYRASRFSKKATEYLAWQLKQHAPEALENPPGRLLPYVLAKDSLKDYNARLAPSRIFPDGGAFFVEGREATDALYGVLWNPSQEDGHSHKEINAVAMTAYGEVLLRNAGYSGWGRGGAGLSWTDINNSAKTANTVLIDGQDHSSKSGGTIIRGFTADGFDFATGFDGGAMPGGNHYRNLAFVDSSDNTSGYWILFDQIVEAKEGAEVNVILRPFSDSINVEAEGREYGFAIDKHTRTENDVHGSIFLGTSPGKVMIAETGMAGWTGNFRTDFINSVYAIGRNGTRNIVTVIFPYDNKRPKAEMFRMEADGYSGASIVQGGVSDLALESSLEEMQVIGDLKFQAKLLWRRVEAGLTTSFFAQGARHFDDASSARIGFEADRDVTIYVSRHGEKTSAGEGRILLKAGRIAPEADAQVTLYFPGLQQVRLDGRELRQLDAGDGWIKVMVPKIVATGAHELEFVVRQGL